MSRASAPPLAGRSALKYSSSRSGQQARSSSGKPTPLSSTRKFRSSPPSDIRASIYMKKFAPALSMPWMMQFSTSGCKMSRGMSAS